MTSEKIYRDAMLFYHKLSIFYLSSRRALIFVGS